MLNQLVPGVYEHPVFGDAPKGLRLDFVPYQIPGAFWEPGVDEAAARLLTPSRAYPFFVGISLKCLLDGMREDIENRARKAHRERVKRVRQTAMSPGGSGTSSLAMSTIPVSDEIEVVRSHFSLNKLNRDICFLRTLGVAELIVSGDDFVLFPTESMLDRMVEVENAAVKN